MASDLLLDALAVTAEICGAREFSRGAAHAVLSELRVYPEVAVLKALERCRRELKGLTLADIISRIEDGRPGAEEAWAMLPNSELESVVWTDEMREAHGVCASLIDEDPIAARMAFRETYTRLVSAARSDRKAVKWGISLGHDTTTRESVIHDAIRKNRITARDAMTMLPDFSSESPMLQISGPVECESVASVERIQLLIKSITERKIEHVPDPLGVKATRERAKAAVEQVKALERDHEQQ